MKKEQTASGVLRRPTGVPGARKSAGKPFENSSGEEFFSFKESASPQTSREIEHEQTEEEEVEKRSDFPIKVAKEDGQTKTRKRRPEDNRASLHEFSQGSRETDFYQKRTSPQSAAPRNNKQTQKEGEGATGATVGKRSSLLDALIEGRKSWPEERTVIVEIKNGRRVSAGCNLKPESQASRLNLKDYSTEGARVEKVNFGQGKENQKLAEKTEKLAKTKNTTSELKENRPEKSQEVEEVKEKAEPEVEEKQTKGSKPPTFGSTPHKLTRLPYFSYFGKARNVSLVSSADRKQATTTRDRYSRKEKSSSGEQTNNSEGTSSSERSEELNSPEASSRSSSSSSSLISRIPAVLASGRGKETEVKAKREPLRKSLTRGYSNISNLFPGKPMSVRGGDRRYAAEAAGEFEGRFGSGRNRNRAQSSSLLNLNQLGGGRPPVGRRAQSATRFASENNPTRASSNSYRYRNAPLGTSSQMPRDFIDDDVERPFRTRPVRGRPSYPAAATNRPSSAAAAYRTGGQYRSPSANSLYYATSGGSPYANLDYYRNLPVDPDCPVHGYSPPPPAVRDTASKLLEPELLYDPYPSATAARLEDEGYFGERRPGGSLYSPSSPQMLNRPAYYNSASRFSVFHSPEVAGGRLPASLAAPQEQLRRILGYQPHQPKPIHLHPQWAYTRPFIHLQGAMQNNRSLDNLDGEDLPEEGFVKPRFEAYNQLHDSQAIRAVDFHPSGEVYAVGSNSRALRICAYPADHQLRHFNLADHVTGPPRVLFKFLQVHRGSIYCVRFNSTGQLLATGSNDQTVHIVRYNSATHSPDGDEFRLTMHDGTIRDLCFIDDTSNGSSLLLSAGGGDNKIYVTDCDTITPFQSMAGHTQMVMALDHWSGATFVSASYDRTVRFWDLRTRNCTSIISAPAAGSGKSSTTYNNRWQAAAAGPGAPACSVKVDPSGRLLASGHSDSTCMLYDIRGARLIQAFREHEDELRTVSFSPKSYYLLTGGYDGRLLLADLQGDLTQPLPSVCVAESDDKIVQSSWHPSDFTFVTTGADKTATLWALPSE